MMASKPELQAGLAIRKHYGNDSEDQLTISVASIAFVLQCSTRMTPYMELLHCSGKKSLR
jgi:hypothetical protein